MTCDVGRGTRDEQINVTCVESNNSDKKNKQWMRMELDGLGFNGWGVAVRPEGLSQNTAGVLFGD